MPPCRASHLLGPVTVNGAPARKPSRAPSSGCCCRWSRAGAAAAVVLAAASSTAAAAAARASSDTAPKSIILVTRWELRNSGSHHVGTNGSDM